MDEPKSQKTSVPSEDRFASLSCGECDRETRHKILAETSTHWEDASNMVDLWTEHQIVQCQGCLTVSFCEASQFSEEMDHDPVTGEPFLPTARKLYPNRIAGRSTMREAHLLPPSVYSIYQESHNALCAQLGVLTGLGLRTIVEAVCKDKGINAGNLANGIDRLATAGLITQAGATILHSLRFMGNVAAHEARAHSLRELTVAFDVVEHLLQTVYVLPKLASELPAQSSPSPP